MKQFVRSSRSVPPPVCHYIHLLSTLSGSERPFCALLSCSDLSSFPFFFFRFSEKWPAEDEVPEYTIVFSDGCRPPDLCNSQHITRGQATPLLGQRARDYLDQHYSASSDVSTLYANTFSDGGCRRGMLDVCTCVYACVSVCQCVSVHLSVCTRVHWCLHVFADVSVYHCASDCLAIHR